MLSDYMADIQDFNATRSGLAYTCWTQGEADMFARFDLFLRVC